MVDEALDALYAGPVETFIAERDRLAKERKAAGDKAGAALLKAQHKPTQVAHALNTLVRIERARIEALLQVGRTLAGGKADFRAALEQQRALIVSQEPHAEGRGAGRRRRARADVRAAGCDGQALSSRPSCSRRASRSCPRFRSGSSARRRPSLRWRPRPRPPRHRCRRPSRGPGPGWSRPTRAGRTKRSASPRFAGAAHAAAVQAAQKLADDAQAEADRLGATAEHAAKVAEDTKRAHAEAVQRAKHLAAEARKVGDKEG